jgi:UDP-hydrolysing UDP-N-acetyl-D-glucosamine 2-epimerase
MRSKVLVLSGSRADYWILEPLIDALIDRESLDVSLGHIGPYDSTNSNHISQSKAKRGLAVSVIEDLPLLNKFENEDIFSRAFEFANLLIKSSQPDLVVYLGDRIEIMAASVASHLSNVPSVHLHGGETSIGSLDDSMRHAITKLSKGHICFSKSALRTLQKLGEATPKILLANNFLALRLERTTEESYLETLKNLGFSEGKNLALVTVHPVTTDEVNTQETISSVIAGLLKSDLEQILLTGPNTDKWRHYITKGYEELLDKSQQIEKMKVVWVPDLGGDAYLSLLAKADVCIGNSSSGVLEAPQLGIPVVDVGKRQLGRVNKDSRVHQVRAVEADVEYAISSALASKTSDSTGLSHLGAPMNKVVDWVLSTEFPFEKSGLTEGG